MKRKMKMNEQNHYSTLLVQPAAVYTKKEKTFFIEHKKKEKSFFTVHKKRKNAFSQYTKRGKKFFYSTQKK